MRYYFVFVFAVAALGIFLRGIPRDIDIDSYAYQAMARGEMSGVCQPYAKRVLQPLLVQTLARFGARDSEWVFKGIALASFALFAFAVFRLVGDRLPPLGVAALAVTPALCLYCVNFFLPDLFYMAQWALLLLLINRDKFLWGALLVFLMQTTRESTVVLAALIIAVAVFKRKWQWAFATAAAVPCGMAFVAWASRGAQPNIHGVNEIVYMATKVLSNIAANCLGVAPWTDSYARQLPHMYPDAPVWKMVLPAWLAQGGVKEIGICDFDPMSPLRTAATFLSCFGVLPALLFRYCKNAGWRRVKNLPFAVLIPLAAGMAFYILGPVTGRSVERLVGYGWPVFVVALPLLCFQNRAPSKTFWAAHLCCQWLPVLMLRIHVPFAVAVNLAVVILCYLLAWKHIKQYDMRFDFQ